MKRRLLLLQSIALLWGKTCMAGKAPSKVARPQGLPDGAVLEAVLKSLLSDPDSPLEQQKAERKQIVFSAEALHRVPNIERILLQIEEEQWKKLSGAQLESVQIAAKQVVQRASAKERFQALAPRDPRILWYTRAAEKRAKRERNLLQQLDSPQVFRAYPPGYSTDGDLAVVYLTFPWSGGFHDGVATYVLARRPGTWEELMRQFVFYA